MMRFRAESAAAPPAGWGWQCGAFFPFIVMQPARQFQGGGAVIRQHLPPRSLCRRPRCRARQ